MGHLIGATGYRIYISDADVHSYEQIEGERKVYGISGYRACAFQQTGDYVAIDYVKQPDVQSRVYDFYNEEIGFGMVIVKGHMVVPYIITAFQINQLHPLRRKILCDYVDGLQENIVRTDYSGVYAYYSKGKQNILILVNSTLQALPTTRFKLTGETARKIYEIDRDGVIRERDFSYVEEGLIQVHEKFAAITTKTFIIES